MTYDVLVAGARCAGASTAMLLARAGLRVLVVDPLPAGRDTLSTHALMRGAVLQLHRWGLLDRIRRAGTPALTTTVFDYGDEVVSIPLKAKDGVDALIAPRRTVLDPILEDAAAEAGATILRGWSVVDVLRDGTGSVVGARLGGPEGSRDVAARWVVGADGVRSRVARSVGAPTLRSARHTTASVYGYWKGIPREENRWTFRPRVGLGTIPTNGGDTCVFVSVRPEVFQAGRRLGLESFLLDQVEKADPELRAFLVPEARSGDLRAFAGAEGFLRRPWCRGWALVGDAGYFRDPLTAHGITDAFRDAELLAAALVEGSDDALAGYQEERDAAAEGLMAVTDRIASLEWTMEEVKALHHRLSKEMNAAMEPLKRRLAA